MKTHTAQQEILLMTGTSFSSRTWCANDNVEDQKNITPEDRLKEACWNGLLDELPGDIVKKTSSGKRLCLWHIQQGKSFIEIELCNAPQVTEKQLSVDPYVFLPIMLQS